MGKPEGRLLIHAIGGGDLGYAGAGGEGRATPDYEGDAAATGRDRRPLRKIFEGLAGGGLALSHVVLVGTTNREGIIAGRTFAEHAEEMCRRLTADPGLCGRRLEPGAVVVATPAEPTLAATSAALVELLARRRPEEIIVTCGSGAFAISMGTLCAALHTRNRVRILHIDHPGRPYTLDRAQDADAYLDSWLLRHRFWDSLAELDPSHRAHWELLAARQAGDTTFASLLRDAGTLPPGLPDGTIGKFTEPLPTAQAALFERVGRGEAADFGLLRSWYAEHLSRLLKKENDTLPAPTRAKLDALTAALRTRADGHGGLAGLLRATAHDIRAVAGSAAVRMLHDDALTRMYTRASTHQAHLLPEHGEDTPLPATLVEAADRWEKDDPGHKLVADTDRTGWPVLGSGDVLGLLAVGLELTGRNGDNEQAVRAVLAALSHRRHRLLRSGRLRLRLLASPEARDIAHRLARRTAETIAPDADIQVIENVTGDIETVRDTVVAALASGPPPTGRTGSESLRDVDEVVVALNPGPAATNHGMIAAAVRWSLTAACPLIVAELTRLPDGRSQLTAAHPVLARLGTDRVLAALTASATRRLDLRTAVRLTGRGSHELRGVMRELKRLQNDLYGPAQHTWSPATCLALARQRLTLIAEICGTRPLPAAYLAVEVLRPALFPWHTWKRLCEQLPALQELSALAANSLQGHALDRRAKNGRFATPATDPQVSELLRRAIRELGHHPDDNALLKAYKSVIESLETIYRESG
ncbi:hypothetical protein AB0K60_29185 [Thermopolyspora sp. NPDC052614]|uniref:hypothetical protein n=1 Tax=Thermopolyspora sp. NPDC052614 TaxID=3155682 RepID=UPI0034345191